MDFAASPFQIKSLDDTGQIEGLGSFFGNADTYGDVIERGAFTKTIAERAGAPLPMLFSHDTHRPIGTWSEVRETGQGLFVKGRLTLATRDGAETYALVKDGAIGGLSIGYTVVRSRDEGHNQILEEVKLFEVSPVVFPANDRATIQRVKSINSARDITELLQERGLSNRRARFAAIAAWKAISENDQSADDQAEIAEILNASAARIAAHGGRQ